MSKQEFETTRGLLRDVMEKQAGSIEKAVLEAVMNSIDAGASEVNITLQEGRLLIEDDGKGMSREEIDKYFKKFGLKDDDIEDKEFGKFRMGRGQIFSFGRNIWATKDNVLVISLDEGKEVVTVQGEDHELDLSGLSYHVLDSNEDVSGCVIEVQLYNKLEDVPGKVKDVMKLIRYMGWLHNVDITVNGTAVDDELDHDAETESAYIEFDRDTFTSRSYVYNKGAFVKREKLGPVCATIVTKRDLDLNFARNDILSGCDVWETVKRGYDNALVSHLLNADNVEVSETNWLVNKSFENRELYKKLQDRPIFHDVKGDLHTLEDLKDGQLTFSTEGDKVAIDMMRRTDVVVLDDRHKDAFDADNSNFTLKEYNDVIGEEMKYEMDQYSEDNLSKRRKENLARLRWALSEMGYYRDVESGVSKHKEVWMTDSDTLMIDKDALNAKRIELATELLVKAMRESAYRCDTRGEVHKDAGYSRRLNDMLDDLPDVQQKLINNSKQVRQHIKRQLN